MSRLEQLAEVKSRLKEQFPSAAFLSNDDANPATPMGVTAIWGNGKIIKTVRADSIRSTVDEFTGKASKILGDFEANAVPTRLKVS